MHLGPRTVEDEEDLVEVGLRIRVDLLSREHGSRFRPSAWVSDHRCVVTDDEDDGMTLVLERAEGVEHDQVADMQVRSGRVQSELDPELVPPIQPALQMLLDVDLNRALAQALEERSA